MSKFSGKCDFYDSIEICGFDFNKYEVYLGHGGEPLKFAREEDLIPYYPHIIGCSFTNNTEKRSVIYLTSKSWVDIEEEEWLEFVKNQMLKYRRRQKRRREEFNIKEAVHMATFSSGTDSIYHILAERVRDEGAKASYADLHRPSSEYYRRALVEEMLKHGLNPADYGYGRFVDGQNNDGD